MKVVRVQLDESDFQKLVAGETVKLVNRQAVGGDIVEEVAVEMILADIGFDRMRAAILAASARSRR